MLQRSKLFVEHFTYSRLAPEGRSVILYLNNNLKQRQDAYFIIVTRQEPRDQRDYPQTKIRLVSNISTIPKAKLHFLGLFIFVLI